jgi:hypothetical protein
MQTKYNTVRPVQVTPGPFQAHKLHCRVEQLRSIAASSTRTSLAHFDINKPYEEYAMAAPILFTGVYTQNN